MTRDELVSFFTRWDEYWTSRNIDALMETYAPDCRVASPMFGQLKGRDAVEEAFRKLLMVFPDWKSGTQELLVDADPDRVALVFATTATHVGEFMGLPGTGRKAQIQGVRIFKMKDGLIEEEQRLYDFTLLLMQVGILRGKPGH
jgi:steroid delta-isomerase-like uncharacterized protein